MPNLSPVRAPSEEDDQDFVLVLSLHSAGSRCLVWGTAVVYLHAVVSPWQRIDTPAMVGGRVNKVVPHALPSVGLATLLEGLSQD